MNKKIEYNHKLGLVKICCKLRMTSTLILEHNGLILNSLITFKIILMFVLIKMAISLSLIFFSALVPKGLYLNLSWAWLDLEIWEQTRRQKSGKWKRGTRSGHSSDHQNNTWCSFDIPDLNGQLALWFSKIAPDISFLEEISIFRVNQPSSF